ncbi:MAG: hypothetical protein HY302_15930 [Opitutae bacterium]|nr:hypothetical protein [Opitutae bacterium]
MKSAPPETAELLQRVRQQLILAQVRIMELEDARDELHPKLATAEHLLAQAQTLADAKVEEAAHLENVRAALQLQFEHLRHMQHVTNEALVATRAQLAAAENRIEGLANSVAASQSVAARLAEVAARLERELEAANATSASRLTRLGELDAELRATKASRSWRWTKWLRALERTFSGR